MNWTADKTPALRLGSQFLKATAKPEMLVDFDPGFIVDPWTGQKIIISSMTFVSSDHNKNSKYCKVVG